MSSAFSLAKTLVSLSLGFLVTNTLEGICEDSMSYCIDGAYLSSQLLTATAMLCSLLALGWLLVGLILVSVLSVCLYLPTLSYYQPSCKVIFRLVIG